MLEEYNQETAVIREKSVKNLLLMVDFHRFLHKRASSVNLKTHQSA